MTRRYTIRRGARPDRESKTGFHPSRLRGQNFLRAPSAIESVLAAIAPQGDEDFLEIGAGRGEITLPLAPRARSVLAIESDRRLVETLTRKLSSEANVEIRYGDFLNLDLGTLLEGRGLEQVRVVGNLPYRVASPILLVLLRNRSRLKDMTLMFQAEVAERLAARPGTKAYGYLSVLTQQAAHVRIVLTLPPQAFWPQPKVRSCLVRLDLKRDAEPPISEPEVFAALVKGLLAHRRKTIANNVRQMESTLLSARALQAGLARSGIDLGRRAETLSVEEFAALSLFCSSNE